METVNRKLRRLAAIALLMGLAACTNNVESANALSLNRAGVENVSLDVYKSPTCGCCEKWVGHIEAAGFETAVHHPTNLNQIKSDWGVSPQHQSCHTAVSQDGFVFEGHIPADVMQRFLDDPPPKAIGLAVPGMPIGSPGMEMGTRQDEYDVLLLNKDGSDAVYERIGGSN